ncbi:heterokaryon incompatibility protein-domain-containing protein [Xylariaceae sp. FL0594]|nr:heterokaryon incompatibility protein-domain-containing protein [Xylariaceae sp. FL0594]
MDVFDMDLTRGQVKEAGSDLLASRIAILDTLYTMSMSLSPRPARIIPPEDRNEASKDERAYQYSKRLTPSNIRMLGILPGVEGSAVECELEERDLENEVVEEALSYVWGRPIFDEVIQLDGRHFRVTKNLHGILCQLRYRDTPRVIWIDAICINQSDLEEKTHQVRLMRDIYSKTQRTVIWLSHEPYEPIWEEIKAVVTHPSRYDLLTILEAISGYAARYTSDEERVMLAIMLLRCMIAIMDDEWWQRAWTIQEAMLPPSDPIIYFQGFSFPFTAFAPAIDLISSLPGSAEMQSELRTDNEVLGKLMRALICFKDTWEKRNRLDESFIHLLRPEKSKGTLSLSLPEILELVIGHRTTEPRDKIYAISSLLARGAGKLVNVNYNEPAESLFGRITAACLNLPDATRNASPYPFLNEGIASNTHSSNLSSSSSPSWVHDFGYFHSRDVSAGDGSFTLTEYLYVVESGIVPDLLKLVSLFTHKTSERSIADMLLNPTRGYDWDGLFSSLFLFISDETFLFSTDGGIVGLATAPSVESSSIVLLRVQLSPIHRKR